MKYTKIAFAALIVGFISTACDSQEKTARNGLSYTVLRAGEGKPASEGEFLVLNMSYKNKTTDSVWRDTGETGPQAFPNDDSTWMSRDKDLQVIFGELNAGDSVTFDVSIQEFFDHTVQAPVPDDMNPTDMIQFNVGLDKVLNRDEIMAWNEERMAQQRAIMEAEMERQFELDNAEIEKYLSENNITTQKTEAGVYYEILEEGTGPQAANGNTVRVAYTGRLLSGEFFDSSYEEVARENNAYMEGRPYGPYEFVLGQGGVIKGWDEGITYLNEGTKARFYIPSPLAYGPQQRSEVIGPNSILVFDIELVEVR